MTLTLQNIAQIDPDQARGTIFSFTDNYATYSFAASGSSPSPRLHTLAEKIRLLELRLKCMLQVVPIARDTDGLSRGMRASPPHELALQRLSFSRSPSMCLS
jgi:hypothetical protein